MRTPFAEALARVANPDCGPCWFHVGSAWFDDSEELERLDVQYAEAVATLTAIDGLPLDPTPQFLEADVAQAACWRRPNGIAYALLEWVDNTRGEYFVLGVAARGTVVRGCWGDAETDAAG